MNVVCMYVKFMNSFFHTIECTHPPFQMETGTTKGLHVDLYTKKQRDTFNLYIVTVNDIDGKTIKCVSREAWWNSFPSMSTTAFGKLATSNCNYFDVGVGVRDRAVETVSGRSLLAY